MSNRIKIIIVAAVLAIIFFASIMVVANAVIISNRIEVGDEVFVVSESINNQAWIVNGTVIEVKYVGNVIVEYCVLLPRNSVVIYGPQESVFLTYNQALKYLLNN